jgi:CheY-like chemotaxis protein
MAASPHALNLSFRSPASFLISYSTQLARGELFIETDAPLPLTTAVVLRLQTPDGPIIELDGTVIWARPTAIGPGQPAGMGIVLATSVESYGSVIDHVASRTPRVKALVATTEAAPRAIITRYLKSILACEVQELDTDSPAALINPDFDLAVIDLDSPVLGGDDLVKLIRQQPSTADLPVIVLAQNERDRARGVALGADEGLTNPPLFNELKTSVTHVLARPRLLVSS